MADRIKTDLDTWVSRPFNARLAAVMERKGLTDQQTADVFGIGTAALRRWKEGRGEPVYSVQEQMLRKLESL